MKIKILILILISILAIKAQSVLIVGTVATLDVSGTANICSDSLSGTITGNGSFCGTPTGIESETSTEIPTTFALDQNYPNPFNPSTKISWQSPLGGHQVLKVYDVLGNEVATLVDEFKSKGTYEVVFNAFNLTSGVYFYKLQIGNFIATKKMTVIK